MDILEAELATFTDVSPDMLQRRALLERIDAKYVVPEHLLPALIARMGAGYAVLRVSGAATASYRSLYYDTAELRCFHDHRRGRRIRHKVRVRHYPDRGLSYVEVKTKRNELVTEKQRQQMTYGQEHLGPRERAFVRTRVGELADELEAALWIDYRRISLLGIDTDERVTIDVGLEVVDLAGSRRSLGAVAVVEVKRAPRSGRTPVMHAMAEAGHREQSMSKYTAAVVALRPTERCNRLRPALRAVERLAR